MSYRCISAFEFAGVIYPGGLLVDDGDQIVRSHAEFFARVAESAPATTETATASPGELRDGPSVAPVKKAAPRRHKAHIKPEHDEEEGE